MPPDTFKPIMTVKSELFTLDQLFSGRLYRVPDYQRAYRWETKQRADLFNDIERSMSEDRQHLMSAIVVVKKEITKIMTTQYQKVDIVDGQQRITTLIILYRAIMDNLDENDPDERHIKDECEKKLIMRDDATTLLLQNNHDTERIFSNYVRRGICRTTAESAETSAEKNLLDAIKECTDFISGYNSDQKSLLDLLDHIKNKILFVYQELADERLAYYVFEGLNNRGLKVSKFDLLKTNLMQTAFGDGNKNMIEEIHRHWSQIYRSIGTYDLESDILRFTATLYRGSKTPLPEEKSREFLLCESKGGAKAVLETIHRLETIATALYEIKHDPLYEASNPKQPVKYVAVAIKIQDYLSDDDKSMLCDLCIKIGFIFFTLVFVESKYYLEEFLELACAIVTEKIPAQEIEKKLRDIVYQIDEEEGDVRDKIMKNVKDDAWYCMESHYLLYKYEEYLTKNAGRAFDNKTLNLILKNSTRDTIEHILPQKSKKSFINYPGNLFLLPPKTNSKLGDMRPKDKADEYRRTGFMMADDIIPQLSKWNKKAVVERGEKIFQWACDEWDRCKLRK